MLRRVRAVFGGALFFLVFAVISCNPGKPDLAVENIILSPVNPTTVDQVGYTAVIKNNGSKASPPCEAVLRVAGETGCQVVAIPALDPGASFSIRKSGTFNIARAYRVTVYADQSQDVPEINENNNEKHIDFTVTKACPDLVAASLIIEPANSAARQVFEFKALVVNVGNMISSPTKVTIKIGRETNSKVYPIPALRPGASHTVLRSESLNTAGNYRVTIYADYGNNIVECSEVNNEKHENFVVK